MRILFVCLGNICRSPTAHGVFRDIASREAPGLVTQVDSAGTADYHVGEPPDSRSCRVAAQRGYDLSDLRARQVEPEDFERFDILSLSAPDNRNMVLFPEKAAGKYCRLERPFPVYSRGGRDRFDIWFADSPDLVYWGNQQLVLGVEDVPFANDKIGPGAPPVKTPRGWLTTFHAVDRDETRGKNGWEESWKKRYTAGIMLLDLERPWQVIGMSKLPLLEPSAPYETAGGFRNHVIFPGGMILEPDGEVKIYYGAADTVVCLATAGVDDLLALCTQS